MRISIIEGKISGERPGYTVHIGADLDNTIKRYRHSGLEIENESLFSLVSRINRMTPDPESPYLSMFKNSYRRFGEYLLVPAACRPDGSNLEIAPDLAIHKRSVQFRNASEITSDDPDAIVLHTGTIKRPLTGYESARS